MFYDIIGWIGMILMVIGYLLLSFNKISNGKTYQLFNLFGSLFMAIGLFPKNAWFSFALQIVWLLVAVISLIKLGLKKG